MGQEGLQRLGQWIANKATSCHNRYNDSERSLKESGCTEEELGEEWDKQVEFQTRPLPRTYSITMPFITPDCSIGRSKLAARTAIEELAALQVQQQSLENLISILDNKGPDPSEDGIESIRRLDQHYNRLQKLKAEIARRRKALGVDGRRNLSKLKYNAFIAKRMNARALKIRLRSKIQGRKFEIQRLKKAHHMAKESSSG